MDSELPQDIKVADATIVQEEEEPQNGIEDWGEPLVITVNSELGDQIRRLVQQKGFRSKHVKKLMASTDVKVGNNAAEVENEKLMLVATGILTEGAEVDGAEVMPNMFRRKIREIKGRWGEVLPKWAKNMLERMDDGMPLLSPEEEKQEKKKMKNEFKDMKKRYKDKRKEERKAKKQAWTLRKVLKFNKNEEIKYGI